MLALTKMLVYCRFTIILLLLLIANLTVTAQNDSTVKPPVDTLPGKVPVDSLSKIAAPVAQPRKVDSVLRQHSPRKAAIRSAIIPGWGQIYNKKYWKLPIVYGALGTAAGVFFYNVTTYRDLRFAYKAKYEAMGLNGAPRDSTNYRRIKPELLPLDVQALRSYRDEFRRNVDYSALAFILLWGLNVVDATVDAHLKTFDVSPDLSFRMNFGHSSMAGTNGISFVLAFK